MAFDNIPTPQQMADNWYNFSHGNCMDCTAEQRAHPGYTGFFLPIIDMLKDAPPINGVPQVKYVNPFHGVPGFDDDPTLAACYDRANQLALSRPGWAKMAGQDGLIKMALACMFEAEGKIPDGYMQALADALVKPAAIDKRLLWVGGAVAVYLLFLRK